MQYPHVFSNKLKPDLLQTTVEWSNYKDEQKDKEKEKELCICLEYLLPQKDKVRGSQKLANWQKQNSESVITGEMHRIIMSDGFHYFAATE